MHAEALDKLLQGNPALWRGTQRESTRRSVSTGFAALDQQLPAAGWEAGSVNELLPEQHGIGEFSLLLPLFAALGGKDQDIALIGAPHRPYAPALANAGLDPAAVLVVQTPDDAGTLWACEQVLRSGAFGAAVCWALTVTPKQLRRLQLATEHGDGFAFLYRPARAAHSASPAALRLKLGHHHGRLRIDILKSRGGPTGTVWLDPAEFDAGQGAPWPGLNTPSTSTLLAC